MTDAQSLVHGGHSSCGSVIWSCSWALDYLLCDIGLHDALDTFGVHMCLVYAYPRALGNHTELGRYL